MTVNVEELNIIKSILNVRCREGATIADIERDYEEMIGKPLLDVYNYLNSIDCFYCIASPNSEPKWYAKSDNMQHITKLIMEQRSSLPKPKPQKILNGSINENSDCYFKDNLIYKNMRSKKFHNQTFNSPSHFMDDISNFSYTSQKSASMSILMPKSNSPSPKRPQPILDAQLVGYDFFRMLVSRDSTVSMFNRNNGVQQTGLCVSGLSISAAAKLIELSAFFKSKNLILNVGSVDILHGHSLRDMCIDFERLINVCVRRELNPIITTLAPLANSSGSSEMHNKLLQFNQWLFMKYGLDYPIIDIWSAMVDPLGQIDSECFECGPVLVSGSRCPHVMWSQFGRTKIRNHMLRALDKILKKNSTDRLFFGA